MSYLGATFHARSMLPLNPLTAMGFLGVSPFFKKLPMKPLHTYPAHVKVPRALSSALDGHISWVHHSATKLAMRKKSGSHAGSG